MTKEKGAFLYQGNYRKKRYWHNLADHMMRSIYVREKKIGLAVIKIKQRRVFDKLESSFKARSSNLDGRASVHDLYLGVAAYVWRCFLTNETLKYLKDLS